MRHVRRSCGAISYSDSGGRGKSHLLECKGIYGAQWHQIIDLNLDECFELLQSFAREHPAVWSEDIGEPPGE